MDNTVDKHTELMKNCIFEDRADLIHFADMAIMHEENGFSIMKCLFIIQATPEELEFYAPLLQSEEVSDWLNDMQAFIRWNEHGNEANLFDISDEDPYRALLDEIINPTDTIGYLLEGDPCKKSLELARRLLALSEKFHAHQP